ncbi:MAG: diguanylate cyclase [Azonexus sp.]|jgi:diguanylate cyclase (GGDEF)-like protein|nr:diguanylate cyclase [Azonexus sp.]
MTLNAKISLFFIGIATGLLTILVAISLYAFYSFSITLAKEHIQTAGEIVRASLTESMINGTINKREGFQEQLLKLDGLESVRVIRSPEVDRQFGEGLALEKAADDVERGVLREGKPRFDLLSDGGVAVFRGIIPYIASSEGNPNCLQCHQVAEGTVLGAISMSMPIESLKHKALLTVTGIGGTVAIFTLLLILPLRRLLRPISDAANAIEEAVKRALRGDFKAHIEQQTKDEIGQIATDMNRLLLFLDDGLNRIGYNVARLTERTPAPGENRLTATIDMVESLTKASRFKQAIEGDESQAEIYRRLAHTLQNEFQRTEFSLYEIAHDKKRLQVVMVDGAAADACRWCDPQIMVRPEACRVHRTGHLVSGLTDPTICAAFRLPDGTGERRHVCFPIMQSGSVGSVVQVLSQPDGADELRKIIPFINVYLRETAPVLETKRLMENLRDSTLRDPMTGLNNRRFLEEYAEILIANVQRKRTHAAILMLDLDYFKMVNDTYGHDAGDTMLKAVSIVLKQSVRAADLVVRYGGEEFMIILTDATAEAAEAVAEKIRAAVEELQVPIANAVLKKTISIGIADFPEDSDTFWQAVKFADVALYQAKEQGRNRVLRFTPSMWSDEKKY